MSLSDEPIIVLLFIFKPKSFSFGSSKFLLSSFSSFLFPYLLFSFTLSPHFFSLIKFGSSAIGIIFSASFSFSLLFLYGKNALTISFYNDSNNDS